VSQLEYAPADLGPSGDLRSELTYCGYCGASHTATYGAGNTLSCSGFQQALDGNHQPLPGSTFLHYRPNTRSQGFTLNVSSAEVGEHQPGHTRSQTLEGAGWLKAIHYRHGEVEHNQIWHQLLYLLYCVSPIGCFAAHFPAILLFQRCTYYSAYQYRVVHDKYVLGHVSTGGLATPPSPLLAIPSVSSIR
jgi:hypothetical protein